MKDASIITVDNNSTSFKVSKDATVQTILAALEPYDDDVSHVYELIYSDGDDLVVYEPTEKIISTRVYATKLIITVNGMRTEYHLVDYIEDSFSN
ncbi:hypothetical protein [Ureibacillus sinduriensis]|uniref:Uncharacterized protein n=1 Tax=Ureibacillus sinduriensis BLB-1 = JCM 15800 TaxID=1384057 RepID=A0A0A3IME1_9BACL|nr:hypothetical protein [Ureibacillus sinduriensis]KGR76007.1 hypothetical protein CD33_09230 [Ureibacillus sinduriensis BLB-1 = JCM 15800]